MNDPANSTFSISRATVAFTLMFVGLVFFGVAYFSEKPALSLIMGSIALVIGPLIALRLPRLVLKSALGKWGLMLGSIAVTLLLCEIGLRMLFAVQGTDIREYQPSFVYGYTEERQFDRRRFISHPFLPYVPRPNDARTLFIYRAESGKSFPYDYKQNSLGFRSPERPFAKPTKTVRIVTLGGSTTWDGATNDQTWPALLERKLNEYYNGTGHTVEVINMAADAYSSPMSLVELALLGVQYEPDLVISYDGVNELSLEGYVGLLPDYRTIIGRFDDSFQTIQSRLPNRVYQSYLISVVTRSLDRLSGVNPDVLGQVLAQRTNLTESKNQLAGVEYFERNLRLMRAMASEYNTKFLAATAHWVQPIPKQVAQNNRLREFFKQEKIDYLDADAFLPHNDWSLHVDQVHWTAKGLDMFSNEWYKKIVAADLLGLNNQPLSH